MWAEHDLPLQLAKPWRTTAHSELLTPFRHRLPCDAPGSADVRTRLDPQRLSQALVDERGRAAPASLGPGPLNSRVGNRRDHDRAADLTFDRLANADAGLQ
jgi:hypothetical protein